MNFFDRAGKINANHIVGFDAKPEFFSLVCHFLNQVGAAKPFGEDSLSLKYSFSCFVAACVISSIHSSCLGLFFLLVPELI
jgi:hypothetical protein